MSSPWATAHELAECIYKTLGNTPDDNLTEGYRLSEETQSDLRRAIPLLQEALRILVQAEEREDPTYDAYCDIHSGQVALQ